MTFSYVLSNDIGRVRLLIPDSRTPGHILEDEEISALLTLEGNNVYLAAAQAVEVVASNESLVQKAITLLDLKTDGPKVAADLRKHAAQLRLRADALAAEDEDPGFDIAENTYVIWAEREYLYREATVA